MSTPLRLLILEDAQDDAELLVEELLLAGFAPHWQRVETEADYLTQLDAGFEIILADYTLPQFDALQALRHLQKRNLDIPLIIVTGSIGEEMAVECMKQGAADYLLKGRLMRLGQAVKQALQAKQLRDEKRQAQVQLQMQLRCDRLLEAIASRIRQSLNLNEIFNTTVAEIQQSLAADRVLLYRFDADRNGTLVAEAFNADWDIAVEANGHQVWVQHVETNDRYRQTEVVDDIDRANLPSEIKQHLIQLKIKAKLVVPILQGAHLWGVLAVHQCSATRRWQPIEIDLLEKLATQVAIAIQQAQLFKQVQQQAEREQLLNQISQTLNSSLDPQRILQEIVRLIGSCFKVDRVSLYAIETKYIRVLTEWRADEQVISTSTWQAPLAEHLDLLDPTSDASFYRVFHTSNYAAVPLTPERRSRVQQAEILSALRVPIFIRDRLFGGLSLQTTRSHRVFTEEEVQLLERMAGQAAIALRNAQSYEHLEQLVRERTQALEEEKLISEAANRAKTEFLANMSHELRTPMTSILGFSRVLLDRAFGSLNEKQHQYLTLILTSGEHLIDLINDLLDLAKIEAGREELFLETLVVREVCQECLALIHERAASRGLNLSLMIAPNITTYITDARRLKQILMNLLSNAVKFTETGSITLSVETSDREIQFSVQDTGIGIAESDQALLFQPFQQIDGSLSRKYGGTGLGLALSRKLAQLCKGDITLKSQLGHGSCFTLHLPLQLDE